MMRRPTLFLTVGLPGTGEATAARRREVENAALRLTKDEWVEARYGHANPPSAQDVIGGRLVQIGLRALERSRPPAPRRALRSLACSSRPWRHGGGALLRTPPGEQRRRLDQRRTEEPRTTWHVADEELTGWATSTSRRQVNSTAVDPSTRHLLDLRRGTSGAG